MTRDDRIVVGYHGTSDDRAARILSTGRFTPSRNDYDWLGHGIYFWEHAPLRAWQWARQKYRDRATVIEAQISLRHCVDLADVRYTMVLRSAYHSLREAFAKERKTLPLNRNKARCLDCLVINYLTSYVLPECQTVRAPFLEGDPIYEGSNLFTQSHIQLVVRDDQCIESKPRRVAQEVLDGLQF